MKPYNCAAILLAGLAISSCYRMPGKDEYSTTPTTNNPNVTNEKNSSFLPGVGY